MFPFQRKIRFANRKEKSQWSESLVKTCNSNIKSTEIIKLNTLQVAFEAFSAIDFITISSRI